jgi:hypothetical protein
MWLALTQHAMQVVGVFLFCPVVTASVADQTPALKPVSKAPLLASKEEEGESKKGPIQLTRATRQTSLNPKTSM